ncbi:MAG: helix-turn-helix transcriptional regulator [Actinocrinis sp.]
MDREQLADFLTRRRQGLTPQSVGLEPRSRSRTPGLRREDVAQMAGISVDYYTRLEQSRGPRPSEQVLGSMARALRLTEDERDYLYRLAGQNPPTRFAASEHVRPGLLLILDRLHDAPAQVVTDYGRTLARNAMAEALFGPLTHDARGDNVTWRHFMRPETRARIPAEDLARNVESHVANLRAVYARRPDDPRVADLVRDLLAASAEFAELWGRHDVAVRRSDTKRFDHELVGTIEFDCETLLTDSGDQQLVLLTVRPGTESYERLALLRVIGRESFEPRH